MPTMRDFVAEKIWKGADPFAGPISRQPDHQGWASDNPMLFRAIQSIRPSVVVEIGVWKGGSVVTMAAEMKRLGIDGVVIAVDTWLGASEHWFIPEHFADLKITCGYPTLYQTFLANIRDKGLQDYVVPLPLDSLNAARVLQNYGIAPDVAHIDAGHDYESVMADLRTWWPMVKSGGALVGDDYHPKDVGVWPEVQRAFETFYGTDVLESLNGKCYVPKG